MSNLQELSARNSNLQELSAKNSSFGFESENSDRKNNDYNHANIRNRYISLPIPNVIKHDFKPSSNFNKLKLLKEKVEKLLAYVDHLNYRMIIINDNLE